MRAAVEHHFTGLTGSGVTGASYDSTKTMIASLLQQSTGSKYEDRYIAPEQSVMINLPEVSAANVFPYVIKWTDDEYWVFAMEASTGTTRDFYLYGFIPSKGVLSFKGFVRLSGTVVAGTKTNRGFRVFDYQHTTGTVSTSGSSTTITGSGTQFVTERIAVGARMGFGMTSASGITAWYEVVGIASDTSLTISSPVTLSAGTPYVIDELRIAYAATNGTNVNGGIHLIKGLNYGTFTQAGSIIPEGGTTDNIRASYLLKCAGVSGAAQQTMTVTIASPAVVGCTSHGLNNGDSVFMTTSGALPTGLAINNNYYVINATGNTFNVSSTFSGSAINTSGTQSGTHILHSGFSKAIGAIAEEPNTVAGFTNHPLYAMTTNSISATTNAALGRFNMRAALTFEGISGGAASGTSPSAYVLKTSTVSTIGTVIQANGARIFTTNHGPGSGITSFYFPTATRIYRCPLTNITSSSTTWLADAMIEVPPGSSTTYSTQGSFLQVDYSSTIDRLVLPLGAGRFGTYISKFSTTGEEADKLIGTDFNRLKLTTTSPDATNALYPRAGLDTWTEDGWMFAVPNNTSSGQNWLLAFPLGVDSYYSNTSNQFVVTPKLATTNAIKLYHVYVDHLEYAGSQNLGMPLENYRVWYRTTGIDDNTGAWVELPLGSDLSDVTPSNYIQLKIAFDILGEICAPTRIYSVAVTYEDGSQDSHYQPYLSKSSASSKIFAWKQTVAWGSNIPNMRIRLYDASTSSELLNDTVTASSYGTWEYSTNGNTWNAWSSSADAVGNFIRYTATSFGYSGVTVRALLTQA